LLTEVIAPTHYSAEENTVFDEDTQFLNSGFSLKSVQNSHDPQNSFYLAFMFGDDNLVTRG
jgi:hypothetical protein